MSSNSVPLNVAIKLGLLMVADKPENEITEDPVRRGSPDGWRVPNFHGNSR